MEIVLQQFFRKCELMLTGQAALLVSRSIKMLFTLCRDMFVNCLGGGGTSSGLSTCIFILNRFLDRYNCVTVINVLKRWSGVLL